MLIVRCTASVQLVNVADSSHLWSDATGACLGRQAHDKRAYEGYAFRAERAFLSVLCILGDS